jgi:hypothetical protein
MKKIVSIKVAFILMLAIIPGPDVSHATQVKRISLYWIENSSTGETHRQEIHLKIKDWVENALGARLVSSHPRLKIAPQIIRLEKKKQELLKYVEQSDGGGEKIDRIKSELPKGLFGPELQWIKLYQAKFWWKKKNAKKMKQLLFEARQLHPDGELLFLGTRNELQKADWEVFEAIAHQWDSLNPIRSKCPLKLLSGTKMMKISGNGFGLNDGLDFLQPGVFLFNWEDSTGGRRTEVIRCRAKEMLNLGQGAQEKGDQTDRLEWMLRSPSLGTDSYLLVEPNQEGFELFSYSSQEGVNKVTDFGKITEPNLIPELWRRDLPEKKEVKWYNKNPSLWWIGGILLSASAAYFVEQQLSQEKTVGWQVRITGLP